MRTLYPHLGKDKLRVLRRPWCEDNGLPLPSASTIGRIVGRAPDKMRFASARLDARGRVKPLRCRAKPRKPQGAKPAPLPCLATDTIGGIRGGIRRDLITLIDPASAFAVAVPSKAPRQTRAALEATLALLPQPPRVLLSDNGSEFEAGFAQVLAEQRIARCLPTPKTPKMMLLPNASIAPFRNPSSTTTKTGSSPILPSSTRNSPTDGCSTTPSAPTID